MGAEKLLEHNYWVSAVVGETVKLIIADTQAGQPKVIVQEMIKQDPGNTEQGIQVQGKGNQTICFHQLTRPAKGCFLAVQLKPHSTYSCRCSGSIGGNKLLGLLLDLLGMKTNSWGDHSLTRRPPSSWGLCLRAWNQAFAFYLLHSQWFGGHSTTSSDSTLKSPTSTGLGFWFPEGQYMQVQADPPPHQVAECSAPQAYAYWRSPLLRSWHTALSFQELIRADNERTFWNEPTHSYCCHNVELNWWEITTTGAS